MNRVAGYAKFRDYHKGHTALLIGAGPGLYNIPLPFLCTYPSFASNRFHIYYDQTGFAPTYYLDLGINHLVTDEQREPLLPMLEEVEAAFVNRFIAHRLPFDNVWGILGPQYYSHPKGLYFSFDPLDIMGIAPSNIFSMLQIAYYMGFKTALIVGMDHYYDTSSEYKHFYPDEQAPHWEKSPGHRISEEQWYEHTDTAFAMARTVYEMDKRRIVNLSEPTECTTFGRGKWEDWE
ncbi:MAG: hypothetical protein A2W28_00150 [Gammaproteobacteria bacterium RBG_16_51_14]|nr:MAG: hypothetical protein A2W28_00150 [Gammaproteobacteria bacterium RBG_16_51_14]